MRGSTWRKEDVVGVELIHARRRDGAAEGRDERADRGGVWHQIAFGQLLPDFVALNFSIKIYPSLVSVISPWIFWGLVL